MTILIKNYYNLTLINIFDFGIRSYNYYISELFLVVRKVQIYKKTNSFFVNTQKYSISFFALSLSKEDFMSYILKYIEFMNTHIDTILNISIFLSLIFIYFHIPKALRLYITGNVVKIEVAEDLDIEEKNDINDKEKLYNDFYSIFIIIYFSCLFFILLFLYVDSQYPE